VFFIWFGNAEQQNLKQASLHKYGKPNSKMEAKVLEREFLVMRSADRQQSNVLT
jgi:hypothetical protein